MSKPVEQRSPADGARLVVRKCEVCEWEGEIVERPDREHGCPWCHGPTALVRIVTSAEAVDVSGEKNPHASSLGRLGGVKGGLARAAALTPNQRRAIAIKAAKARWTKTKP